MEKGGNRPWLHKPHPWLRKRPYEGCYNGFKKQVELKGKHSVSITYEDFLEIIAPGVCYYCDKPLQWPEYGGRDKGVNKSYQLDRLYSNCNYIWGNVVACCKDCNFAKHTKEPLEFYAWVSRLYHNLKKRDLVD